MYMGTNELSRESVVVCDELWKFVCKPALGVERRLGKWLKRLVAGGVDLNHRPLGYEPKQIIARLCLSMT